MKSIHRYLFSPFSRQVLSARLRFSLILLIANRLFFRQYLLVNYAGTAIAFENWQTMPFFSWYTDSGFSAEDLVSDLLGFYKAVRPQNYWPWLKIVSKEAALRRWDYYGALGSFKNRGFNPLLFPDPADTRIPHIPYKGRLPNFMMSIRPFTQFDSDIVRRIDAGAQVTVGWDVKKK